METDSSTDFLFSVVNNVRITTSPSLLLSSGDVSKILVLLQSVNETIFVSLRDENRMDITSGSFRYSIRDVCKTTSSLHAVRLTS